MTLKENNPSLWNKLQLLMDHDDDRKTENEYENDEHFKVGI